MNREAELRNKLDHAESDWRNSEELQFRFVDLIEYRNWLVEQLRQTQNKKDKK